MHPGQVSEVVESGLGFHVLLKRSPPPREEISGQRIVIRYDTTFGDGSSSRSRGAALELARKVAAEARAGADFATLVERYSEGIDRARSGDLGVQATTDPGMHSLLVEALARVPVGEVLAEPVETSWGFGVAKRGPPKRRLEYAARVVRVLYQPGDPVAATAAKAKADDLARNAALGRSPLREASELERIRWFDGQGDPILASIIEHLAPDRPTLVPLRNAYAAVERVEPDTFCPPPEPRYDLPSPSTLDLDGLFRSNRAELLAQRVQELKGYVPALGLSSVEGKALGVALEGLHSDLVVAKSPDSIVSAYRANIAALHRSVSEASYARIVSGVNLWLAEKLLSDAS